MLIYAPSSFRSLVVLLRLLRWLPVPPTQLNMAIISPLFAMDVLAEGGRCVLPYMDQCVELQHLAECSCVGIVVPL